jgi:hypothetical protein
MPPRKSPLEQQPTVVDDGEATLSLRPADHDRKGAAGLDDVLHEVPPDVWRALLSQEEHKILRQLGPAILSAVDGMTTGLGGVHIKDLLLGDELPDLLRLVSRLSGLRSLDAEASCSTFAETSEALGRVLSTLHAAEPERMTAITALAVDGILPRNGEELKPAFMSKLAKTLANLQVGASGVSLGT